MDRRDFLKKTFAIGATAGLTLLNGSWSRLFAQEKTMPIPTQPGPSQPKETSKALPDLVALKGGEPDTMLDQGMKAFGGMGRFVKRHQTVVIKPNIGWNKSPEMAATTNPKLIKRLIEHCLEAGAKKVYVFDNPVSSWQSAYSTSGIESAVKAAGGTIVPGATYTLFQKVKIPGAKILKEAAVHELILEADVFINVPVLKDHSSSNVTISLKNLMGIVYDRHFFHSSGLHQCIVDINKFRKPDLTIVDAYRVVNDHGPQPYSSASVSTKLMQIIAIDPVAADTASAKILGRDPAKVDHIVLGQQANLGTMNLESLNIQRINL
jgi:uncharacterized protein (DUF362 family)